MPRGDGTGSEGKGSMTGRGAGKCAGNNSAGFQDPVPRARAGRGLGRSAGLRQDRGLGRAGRDR